MIVMFSQRVHRLHGNVVLLFLPGAPVKYGKWMRFSVKDPIFKGNNLLIPEQYVEILEPENRMLKFRE